MSASTTHPSPGSSPTRSIALVTAVALLAAPLLVLVALLGAPSAQAAEQSEPTPGTGWIRAGHLAAGNGAADVRLTPFVGGDSVTVRDVAYGDVTAYQSVEPGLYTVAVLPAGSDMSTNPMVSTSVRVQEGRATSVFAVGDKDDVRSQVVQDDLTPPAQGQARVRLLSGAGTDDAAETVDATLDAMGMSAAERTLAEDVAAGQSTGYAEVPAQTWSVTVSSSAGQSANGRVPVEAGSVYTLLVLEDEDGALQLSAVEDASGSTMTPQGGVDTGAGGLARAGADQAVGAGTATYVASTAGLAGLVGLLGLALLGARGRSRVAARVSR